MNEKIEIDVKGLSAECTSGALSPHDIGTMRTPMTLHAFSVASKTFGKKLALRCKNVRIS